MASENLEEGGVLGITSQIRQKTTALNRTHLPPQGPAFRYMISTLLGEGAWVPDHTPACSPLTQGHLLLHCSLPELEVALAGARGGA